MNPAGGSGRIRVARQVLGLATIVVVLSLALAEAFLPGVANPPGRLTLLVGLAGTLLGLDAARKVLTERVSFDLTVAPDEDDRGNEGQD